MFRMPLKVGPNTPTGIVDAEGRLVAYANGTTGVDAARHAAELVRLANAGHAAGTTEVPTAPGDALEARVAALEARVAAQWESVRYRLFGAAGGVMPGTRTGSPDAGGPVAASVARETGRRARHHAVLRAALARLARAHGLGTRSRGRSLPAEAEIAAAVAAFLAGLTADA